MTWTLSMSLIGPYGERYTMAQQLDDHTAREVSVVRPPDMFMASMGAVKMEQVVEVLRRRGYRKDMFISEAKRLGALLAERMEDAEGWHDESRIEPAKKQLGGKS